MGIEQEPRRLLSGWIYLLCFTAGFNNLATLKYYSVTTSHQTGNLSNLANALLEASWANVGLYLGVLITFILGGVISGLVFNQRYFHWQRPYASCLIGLGIIYGVTIKLMGLQLWGVFFMTLVSGILNSLLIYFRGTLVRTTHFSGYLTDIGVEIGHWLRGDNTHVWRIGFYSWSIVAFFLGGCLSIYCSQRFGLVYLPYGGLLLIGAGLYYYVFRHRFQVNTR